MNANITLSAATTRVFLDRLALVISEDHFLKILALHLVARSMASRNIPHGEITYSPWVLRSQSLPHRFGS
ncbi:hypothetical protein [Aurantimonas marina]|uniref:hypothetical protein n=1 Tax=Aurantimonas marina TaxID=2780508 RepID=UPI0019D275CD|nr:hypothetical protein [Aurantimonas marina]